MPSLDEIRRGFAGAWALARGRAEGMAAFDVSLDGFWRSFSLFLLLIPASILGSAAERRLGLEESGLSSAIEAVSAETHYLVQLVATLMIWVAFPVVMAVLAPPLALGRRYVPFIVARNWASLVEAIPFAVPAVLYVAGLISADALAAGTLFALGFSLYYGFRIARIALLAPVSIAIALVALNLLLTLVIGLGMSRLFL